MKFTKLDMCFRLVEKFQLILSCIATLFVTFMFVLDISMRFFFNSPLPASWEISQVLMAYIVMFGFAYTLTMKQHIQVSILTDRLPPKPKLILEVFSDMISFAICILLTYWSWLQFWHSFIINEEILAAVKVPWWAGKFVMPIVFCSCSIRYLFNILENLGIKNGFQER